MRKFEQIAEFGKKHAVIGAFLPAILRLPTPQEVFNLLQYAVPRPLTRDNDTK